MARIRTVKPEFWDSPSTAQADLAVRLTFMAMWNWADDSGHGTANLKELEAFCWPNDDVRDLPRGGSGGSRGKSAHEWRNFAEICGEVAEVYGVTFYRVSGRPYYEITNFKRHQSKDYRKESRYPLPDEGEIFDVTSGNAISGASASDASDGPSGDRRGNSAAVAGDSGIGTGEQGNRGTGEQGNSKPRERGGYSPEFDTFWATYPRKEAKRQAWKAWGKAIERATPEQITSGASRYADDPNRSEQFTKHGATWLNADSWDDEPLPSPVRPAARGNTLDAWGTPAGQTPQMDFIDGEVVEFRRALP